MRLIIPGNVPSQKNSKRIVTNRRSGSPMIVSNDRVLIWKRMAILELQYQVPAKNIKAINQAKPVGIALTFYFDNHRRHDLDNAAAGVMDALVASGMLVDDSVTYVHTLSLTYGGIDKTNPRVEIFI